MRVFITGMTGTLGTAIALLHKNRGDSVMGCARNEFKVCEWRYKQHAKGDPKLQVLVCDAGRPELKQYMDAADRVYHCAAMKHVDLCEQNPLEAWRQNVELTAKVCNDRTVFISSDKAAYPGGVYGCTKLTGERIALQTKSAVVRFGNLIGSSGSVLQLWRDAKELTLTDPEMTRYFIDVKSAARFAVDDSLFGHIRTAVTMKAVRMGDLAAAYGKPVKITGPRPGETKHQWLIAPGETVNGEVWSEGLKSSEALRWDAKELLKEMP